MATRMQSELRRQIDEALQAGLWTAAQGKLERLWAMEASPALAGYILSGFERMKDHLPMTHCRVAILRSFTVEPLVPILRAAGYVHRLDVEVWTGGYNAYAQEILDPASELDSSRPDVVILAVQTRDIAPELWDRYCDRQPPEAMAAADHVAACFAEWVRALRSRSDAQIVIHSLEEPAQVSEGLLDARRADGQRQAIYHVNQELRRIAASEIGVYVLDYDALVARFGREIWHDPSKWNTINLPVAAASMTHVAEEWVRFLCPLSGRIAKTLVTDLDNTLWGGVVGEDGAERLQIGPQYPGAAFQAVQRALLDCCRRGILLAICSKNNREDAVAAFQHPGMLLDMSHFSAERINWQDKSTNLRAIAAELNIGLDSLAFLDDNPIERERVRAECPEVTVVELPEDPNGFARALRDTPELQRLSVSVEDQERSQYYAGQRQRIELERSARTVEDFYRSLQQVVEIERAAPATFARVAQLSQKTNQFNLTTVRYNEGAIASLSATPGFDVYTARVRDCFGDNGLTGVAVTHSLGDVCVIDALFLSCRVLSRTIETAILHFLVERCRRKGLRRLQGWFLPTRKNAPAQEFYGKHGFLPVATDGPGTLWALDVETAAVACPEWIQLQISSEKHATA